MGALTSSRKRNDECLNLGWRQPHINSPEFQSLKRRKFSSSAPERFLSSRSTISRVSWYPEAASRLHREVHAPVRPHKFGSFTALSQFRDTTSTASGIRGGECSDSKMGNILSYKYEKVKRSALGSLRFFKVNEVIDLVDEEPKKEVAMSEDSSVEAIEDEEPQKEVAMRRRRQVIDLVDEEPQKEVARRRRRQVINLVDEEPQKEVVMSEDSSVQAIEVDDWSKSADKVVVNLQESVVSELSNGHRVAADKTEELLVPMSLHMDDDDLEVFSKHAYQKLLEDVHRRRNPKLSGLESEIKYNQEKLSSLYLVRPPKKPEEDVPREPFVPLTDEEEEEVRQALSGNQSVLVTHKSSGIEITGEVLQCLRPRGWLNDEVINLYLELLKERERREPKKFLKCHFFNTFFYNKLVGKDGYDYKSVRRWTTQRKLGYSLIDCEKIFVPIHQKVHWCLAVINKKEEKFQYLDSLGGRDSNVLRVLATYFVDEVKDKSGKDINVRSWTLEYVEDLPGQENLYDCGMFMIKYADFYSRGLDLCFCQEHMPYFRRRTAKEILKLRAD